MNRLLATLLIFLSYLPLSIHAQKQVSISDMEVSDVINQGVITVSEISGTVLHKKLKTKDQLELGDTFFETSYIETDESGFTKLLLPNNSMVYIGPMSTIKLHEIKGKSNSASITLEVIKGRMRIIGYKGEHFIKTPKGATFFSHADVQWDVYRMENTIVSEVIKYSGKVQSKGEMIKESSPTSRPEVNITAIDSVNRPWEHWLGKKGAAKDYRITYRESYKVPKFDSFSGGRSIASVDEGNNITNQISEEELDSEFILISDDQKEEAYDYPKVSKAIYVHENLFDHILIHVEKAAEAKAKEIAKVAYHTGAKEIIWDVASRSLIRWGAQYAQLAAVKEIPTNLEAMYEEIEKRDINFKKSKIYVDSVERISKLKSYTTAKNTIKNKATIKAIQESQAYLLSLTKKIVTPPMQYQVYQAARESAFKAADEFMSESKLVKTKDVQDLAEYLAQLAAKRFTERELNKVEVDQSYQVASEAVLEATQRGADKIATYISTKVSKRTAQLFNKMLDQEVAERAARNLASENQLQLGQKYKNSKRIEQFR